MCFSDNDLENVANILRKGYRWNFETKLRTIVRNINQKYGIVLCGDKKKNCFATLDNPVSPRQLLTCDNVDIASVNESSSDE